MWINVHKDLPSEYQELRYIQSSGNCIIEIWWFTLSWYEKIQSKFNPVSFASSDSLPFFYWTVPDGENYLCANSAKTYFQIWAWSSWIVTTVPLATNTDYETETILDNWNLTFTANWTTYTGTYSWSLGTAQFPLFCRYRSSQDGYNYYSQNMKLYYFKLYNSESNLVRDLIPCYRKSDDVIWMYDLVNNQFYTNSWTWTFIKWPEPKSSGKVKRILIWKNGVEKQVYPAWIHISSDLRWATLAGLQAQWWDNILYRFASYVLDANGLTNSSTENDSAFLYKNIPDLNSNNIITIKLTGNMPTWCYIWSDMSNQNTFPAIYSNSLRMWYKTDTKTTPYVISYNDSTALWTQPYWDTNWNITLTTKVNLSTGVIEYNLTSPKTFTSTATLTSTQLTNILTYKNIWVRTQKFGGGYNWYIHTVELTIE